MKQRQRGMTFLGIVMILLILGAALYGGIRPCRCTSSTWKSRGRWSRCKDEHAAIETSAQMIRNSLERRWDVEDIKGHRLEGNRDQEDERGLRGPRRVRGRAAVRRQCVPAGQVRQDRSSSRSDASVADAGELGGSSGWGIDSRPRGAEAALTHRSAGRINYERLEFLGDAVLNCVVADARFTANSRRATKAI